MASLFQEFRLKDVVLRNRIAVSPMCEYSSDNGFPNDWHLVHLGSRAVGGAGLVMVEATAVSPDGRISPADSGIYLDDHVEPFARISRFLKQHGAVPGIQLAHAGRKGSANKPWEGDDHIETGKGGWETIAPSAVPFGGNLLKTPREMTVQDIARVQEAFVSSAQRALAAGFEWLELHFAHGYLAHEFYSLLSNRRTDNYGGSFENRIRFMVETFAAVRKVWPERLPLTARLSVTDWIEGGVTVDESIELVRRLKAEGLDLLDVSHGFNTPDISKVPWGPGFMIPTATQPIAVDDVLAYLLAAKDMPLGGSRIFEIGCPDVTTYGGMIREYARQKGLRRWLISVPVLTPYLSSLWLALVTPAAFEVGRHLIEGLKNPTVVRDKTALDVFTVRPMGIGEAIQKAIFVGVRPSPS